MKVWNYKHRAFEAAPSGNLVEAGGENPVAEFQRFVVLNDLCVSAIKDATYNWNQNEFFPEECNIEYEQKSRDHADLIL